MGGIVYFTEIVTVGEFAHNPGPGGRSGRNDEVGMPEEDFDKSGAVVEP